MSGKIIQRGLDDGENVYFQKHPDRKDAYIEVEEPTKATWDDYNRFPENGKYRNNFEDVTKARLKRTEKRRAKKKFAKQWKKRK